MKRLKKQLYPLKDLPTREECERLVRRKLSQREIKEAHSCVKARPTGEFRPPKKGEYFLSGAVVEAYRSPSDLLVSYYIAKLVLIRKTIYDY